MEDPEGAERRTPRFPSFSREFREGVRSAADYVGRVALVTAGALAGADPGAWASVKRIKTIEDVGSVRMGRHRALLRLTGEDGIEFLRLIHRRDLESTLRRMSWV